MLQLILNFKGEKLMEHIHLNIREEDLSDLLRKLFHKYEINIYETLIKIKPSISTNYDVTEILD